MLFSNNITSKTRINVNVSRPTDVVELMKKARLEKSKEKIGTVIVVSAAISVVIIVGLIISL